MVLNSQEGGFIMRLTLNDVKEEDRGVVAPCGIVCLACEMHRDESVEAARRIIEIWEGFNLPDVAPIVGMTAQEVNNTLETLRQYVERKEKAGPCPGCYGGGGPQCSLVKCVKAKGYWTCAECDDFNPDSEVPCLHSDADVPSMPLGSRREASGVICKRYSRDNVENLKRCREIGYPAFISETREKVRAGWRTWQVISKDRLFTQR